jgi:hypothetical protein
MAAYNLDFTRRYKSTLDINARGALVQKEIAGVFVLQ